jgi:hypothetical protein
VAVTQSGARVPVLGYLVFFVADPVDDELAAAVREVVATLAGGRSWSGPLPGFFDDPDPGEGIRTTGGFLRVEERVEADALALLDGAVAVSALQRVTVEVQWRERVLGHVRDGEPDAELAAAVRRLDEG